MYKFRLLPRGSKKIAGWLIVISLLIPIVAFCFHQEKNHYLFLFKSASKILIVMAGLIFMFSKEKNEDEMIDALRLRAITVAFLIAVIGYILDESHIMDYFQVTKKSTFHFIVTIEFLYIIYFYLLRNTNLTKNSPFFKKENSKQ